LQIKHIALHIGWLWWSNIMGKTSYTVAPPNEWNMY